MCTSLVHIVVGICTHIRTTVYFVPTEKQDDWNRWVLLEFFVITVYLWSWKVNSIRRPPSMFHVSELGNISKKLVQPNENTKMDECHYVKWLDKKWIFSWEVRDSANWGQDVRKSLRWLGHIQWKPIGASIKKSESS